MDPSTVDADVARQPTDPRGVDPAVDDLDLAVVVGTLSSDPVAHDAAVRFPARALRGHRARPGARRHRARRLGRAHAARRRWSPATASSWSAGCGAGSSGPAAPPGAAPRSPHPRSVAPGPPRRPRPPSPMPPDCSPPAVRPVAGSTSTPRRKRDGCARLPTGWASSAAGDGPATIEHQLSATREWQRMNQDSTTRSRAGRASSPRSTRAVAARPRRCGPTASRTTSTSGDDEMFDRIHEMRTRIITSPAFTGDRILGAILFEDTMDREIEGTDSADYLWDVKSVVPFLKVDKGLADEADGVQVMKPMPDLDDLLAPGQGQGRLRHQDALGHQAGQRRRRRRHRRAAVRGRPPDRRRRPGADPRARDRHPQPDQGRGRGTARSGIARSPRPAAATTRSSCSS